MDKKREKSVRHLCYAVIVLSVAAALLLTQRGNAGRQSVFQPLSDGPLSGHVIAVDPGHGGYDGGARASNGRWEKEYNLDVSLRLRDYLQSLGATVVMTRDGDYALCDINPQMRKKRQDMERRAELVIIGGAELLVSIHMNEYRRASASGPQVFYRADCPAGKQLAEVIQAQMNESLLPKKAREANIGDFYIISLGIPSVLVECGFLSNAAEEALLRTEAYTQRVAEAIGDGIVNYYLLENREMAAERENR